MEDKNTEKNIIIQCACKGHYFLTFWQSNFDGDNDWYVGISTHGLSFWRRLVYAFKIAINHYSLSDWEDFIVTDEDMKKLVLEVDRCLIRNDIRELDEKDKKL